MNAPTTPLAAEFDAALHWWRLAGVDCDFAEDATDWLAEPNVPQPQVPQDNQVARKADEHVEAKSQNSERIDLLGKNPPADLEAFQRFWLEAPGLDAIGPRGRVAPRGPANADLMVLVIDPEERDSERLLGGPQGALLSNMLAAMGMGEDEVYIASALPRHTPMADTASLAAGGMDAVVLHHIALAAPRRVVAFGANIPPFLGHALAKDLSSLREINQKPESIPLLVNEGLDSLMAMPRLKVRFWRRWMEWSGGR